MADQAEQAFIKTFLSTLSTQQVAFPNDYQQPLENWFKKVPILPVALPPPPKRSVLEAQPSSSALITLVFKSAKPPASYSIAVQLADPISSIKAQIAEQPTAPPADAQRLLFKGKVLADSKLLKEYNVNDGDTINLLIKPGFDWNPSKPQEAEETTRFTLTSPTTKMQAPTPITPISTASLLSDRPTRKHQRIPSVVLSPSPSAETPGVVEKDITLTLDATETAIPTETLSTYHVTISNPEFWKRLYTFLKSEFTEDTDALQAFEDFLRASKGSLTASEIAKIRDQVGVVGMAGM